MYAYRISKKYAKEGEIGMEDVVKDEVKNERTIDEKVLKCYYSICKYYNKDIRLVYKYLQ